MTRYSTLRIGYAQFCCDNCSRDLKGTSPYQEKPLLSLNSRQGESLSSRKLPTGAMSTPNEQSIFSINIAHLIGMQRTSVGRVTFRINNVVEEGWVEAR